MYENKIDVVKNGLSLNKRKNTKIGRKNRIPFNWYYLIGHPSDLDQFQNPDLT